MKSKHVVVTPATLLLALGIFWAQTSEDSGVSREVPSPCTNQKMEAMHQTLTGYRPSCKELSSTGVPTVQEFEGLLVIVVPNHRRDYYHKFAIGYTDDPAESPEVVWQGAALSDMLEQVCKQ